MLVGMTHLNACPARPRDRLSSARLSLARLPRRLAAPGGLLVAIAANHEQRDKPHDDAKAGSGAGVSTYWLVLAGTIVTSMAGQTLLKTAAAAPNTSPPKH